MGKINSDSPSCFQEIARHLRPRSLRAQFGLDKVHNAIHCTDLPEDAVLEVGILFTRYQYNIYRTLHVFHKNIRCLPFRNHTGNLAFCHPATFPYFCENVLHFLLYFGGKSNSLETAIIFSSTKIFCGQKLCENDRGAFQQCF